MPRTFRMASPDAELLALARAGDAEAFDAIVTRYRGPMLRYCAGLTRPERVDDAVQQTFLNAWLALERGVVVRELRPWLYSIARNAAIDQFRVGRAEQVELSTELPGGADPAAVAAARGELDDVLRAVADLPERQRTALLETSVHGRPTEQVAGELGMTGGALRQLVHRARTSVRSAVASVLPTPLASWFAQTGGEEGTRRLAMLIGGAGQRAAAPALGATATVASIGAVGSGGLDAVSAPKPQTTTRSTANTVRAEAAPASALTSPGAVVTLPFAARTVASASAAATSSSSPTSSSDGARADHRSEDGAPRVPRRSRSAGDASAESPRSDRRPAGEGGERRGAGRPQADGHEHEQERERATTRETRTAGTPERREPRALAAAPRERRRGGGERGDARAPSAEPDVAQPGADSPAATPVAAATAPEPAAPTPSTAGAAAPDQSATPGGEGTAGSASSMSSS